MGCVVVVGGWGGGHPLRQALQGSPHGRRAGCGMPLAWLVTGLSRAYGDRWNGDAFKHPHAPRLVGYRSQQGVWGSLAEHSSIPMPLAWLVTGLSRAGPPRQALYLFAGLPAGEGLVASYLAHPLGG